MKKILCIIMSVIFVFSCFSLTSFAADCGHKYNLQVTVIAPTCTEQGYTLYICDVCGAEFTNNYKDSLGHSYGEWGVITAPTCSSEGLEQRSCVREGCPSIQTRTTSVLSHTDADSDNVCDLCGENVSIKNYVSPFEWLIAFFNAIRQWIAEIFA